MGTALVLFCSPSCSSKCCTLSPSKVLPTHEQACMKSLQVQLNDGVPLELPHSSKSERPPGFFAMLTWVFTVTSKGTSLLLSTIPKDFLVCLHCGLCSVLMSG